MKPARLAVLTGCLIASLTAVHAAPIRLDPLRSGQWTSPTADFVNDVKVAGHYAYVALILGELAVIDINDPSRCVRVGGVETGGYAWGLAISGNYAYVAAEWRGLVVVDISDPTNCVTVSTSPSLATSFAVTVSGHYAYVRVNADVGVPFTIEAAGDLSAPMSWAPIFTTNVATMPFDFVDFDVRLTNWPRKFYRVRQP